MRRLLGLCDKATEVGLGTVAEIVLFDRAIAKIEEAQAQAKLSGGGALNHAVALKHHEETMGCALVQLE
jgi:hypothetical protein